MCVFKRLGTLTLLVTTALLLASCQIWATNVSDDLPHAPLPGVELLQNPGFEDLTQSGIPRSWSTKGHSGAPPNPFETGEISFTSEAARTGDVGVRMEMEEGGGANFILSQRVEVIGGRKYNLSTWVKSDLEPEATIRLKMEFYDESNTWIGPDEGGEGIVQWSDSFSEWEKIGFEWTAPTRATRVTLLLRLYGPGTLYFDDASFTLVE